MGRFKGLSKTCIKCKTDNKDDAEYCVKCGSPFKDVKIKSNASEDEVNNQNEDEIVEEEINNQNDDEIVDEKVKTQNLKNDQFEKFNSDKAKKKGSHKKLYILIIIIIVLLLAVCAIMGVFDTRETAGLSDGSSFKIPSGFEYNQFFNSASGTIKLTPDSNTVGTSIRVGLYNGESFDVQEVLSEKEYTLNGYSVNEQKCIVYGDDNYYD